MSNAVAELRNLLAAAAPLPWEGAEEPEFVGLFAGPEPDNLTGYVGEIRSHANAALALAAVNALPLLLAAIEEHAADLGDARQQRDEAYRELAHAKRTIQSLMPGDAGRWPYSPNDPEVL